MNGLNRNNQLPPGNKTNKMKHKFLIWCKNREKGTSHITAHTEMNESDIERYALNEYLDYHDIDNAISVFEYSASLDETII